MRASWTPERRAAQAERARGRKDSEATRRRKSAAQARRFHDSEEATQRRMREQLPPTPDRCECCGGPPLPCGRNLTKRAFCADHDHETGLFRGWLCSKCNTGLGLIGDDLDAARRLVAYLERPSFLQYSSPNRETK